MLDAILTQFQNNTEQVISFASRGLSKAEKNYATTEKECLACILDLGLILKE